MGAWTSTRVARLACTVRGCAKALALDGDRLICERGHAFDLARSGYANLLQPHDRSSKAPGDAKLSVLARSRLHAHGVTRALDEALVRTLAELFVERAPGVLDVGCGDGHHLAALAESRAIEGYGVDLSTHAIELAAKRHPALAWLVANSDRRLPFQDGALEFVLSIAGPKSAPEFARVLSPSGRLLVVVPGPDDLVELRALVLGEGREIERGTRASELFSSAFELESRSLVRARARLEPELLRDALASGYRAGRHVESARAAGLQAMDVTFAWELLRFRPRA